MGIEVYAILNDVHLPYEERTRYKVALNIIKRQRNLKHIFLNGDIAEFAAISTYAKHPGESPRFNDEIHYINKKFDEIETEFADIPVSLIEGNHCYRLFRYIRDLAPQMWGLVDCPSLFRFPERRWKFHLYGPEQLVKCGASNLYLRHEPLGGGMNHAKATAEKSYVDIAYGHTHMYQSYAHRKFGPRPFITRAYSLGYLGDRNRAIFDYRGSKDNWIEGMTLVECDTKTGDYTLDFIDLRKLPVLYRGERYDAK
jgi:predicted phosphodiesterase